MPDPQQIFLELDSRKRVSLGSLATSKLYLANVDRDGTIVLTPAVVMTKAEAEDLSNKAEGATDRAEG